MSLLDFFISPAAAQSAAAPAAGGFGPLIMIAVMFVVMWFLMIRPQMKRQKEQHRELISKLSKGDEIITSGGIAGRVDDLGDNFITVEIADNTKIKLQRNAITAVLPKGTLKSA